jgi:hypothetical protein
MLTALPQIVTFFYVLVKLCSAMQPLGCRLWKSTAIPFRISITGSENSELVLAVKADEKV